ncbi:MAG: oxidoreductase [Pseudomonadota bacterium]
MAAADQTPIGSGFHAKSTAAEVIDGIDLSGRNAIITGGYSGIGLETVRAIAGAGAKVTVPARRPEAAQEALASLSGDIEIAEMDLGDIASVRSFAADYVASGRALHLLINNAGIMACPETRVGPGWESQFGVNHLGHMALYLGLEPALVKADSARVVALSSTAHIRGGILWDDIHFENTEYEKWTAYAQAKSANALFAMGVDARGRDHGIRAFSVHPGGIFTPLQRHLPDEEMVALGWKNADGTIPDAIHAMFKTPEQGASTTVWAATSPQLEGHGGVYCEDADIAQLATDDSQRWEHVRPWACDTEGAAKLWTMSEEMLAKA